MKKTIATLALASLWTLSTASASHALILDFTGGTAYLDNGTTVITDNTSVYSNVDRYVEDGFEVDFIGSTGVIGNYYSMSGVDPQNSVLHAHWGALTSIVFRYLSGDAFDLNYLDLTSNTTTGGGLASGTELSYVTPSGGTAVLLPSSDWGIGYLASGTPDDDINDIERLWMDSAFDNITSFTVTSENAYCFGLDNFYIDEEAPPPSSVPEPGTLLLIGTGLVGLVGRTRRKKMIG